MKCSKIYHSIERLYSPSSANRSCVPVNGKNLKTGGNDGVGDDGVGDDGVGDDGKSGDRGRGKYAARR